MLTYFFNDKDPEPLYQQLYRYIKEDIEEGQLSTDEKLPSKRSFAKNLNLSTITIENAYSKLMAEGYIYSLPKRGYFVADVKKRPEISGIKSGRIFDAPEDGGALIDLAGNNTNPDNFPFSVWAKLMREVILDLPKSLMTSSPPAGIYALREAIAAQLRRFRGMDVKADNIVIGAGNDYLYRLIIELLGCDRHYALEEPGYRKLRGICSALGLRHSFISIDDRGINMEELRRSGADVLHFSPAHHYPSGIVTPIDRRYEIIGWAAADKNRYIIEDDYDSEFRMTGKPVPTLQSIDELEKVIYLNTFSKTLCSTIRISYMVLPDHLLRQLSRAMGSYSCTVSNFEQYTLLRFLNDGHFESHINRMRQYYKALRDSLLGEIKVSPLSERVTVAEENAGLHFLLKINTELPDAVLYERALKKGLRLSFLSSFYRTPASINQHILVINYSGINPEDIKRAVDILTECISG
ncbi:MAG: PLP-dependent aminotransferase family protein [Candidatus Limivicinus sp.]|jgi:GntR family transcriptional regulator/MocR family aminotransferase